LKYTQLLIPILVNSTIIITKNLSEICARFQGWQQFKALENVKKEHIVHTGAFSLRNQFIHSTYS